MRKNLQIDILSLFPGYFKGPFDESILKRAQQQQLLQINLVDMRQFADNRHGKVDDRPYGGGPGMVLMPTPVAAAIRHVKKPSSHVIYLSPQGTPLTAAKCKELAAFSHLVLVAGHYEGIDQRVLDKEIDEEISIGDYVLTNGCLAAIVLVDSVCRFIPGVLGHERAALEDSFEVDGALLEHPLYTRPPVFEGQGVPEVLLQGDHSKILLWCRQKALEKTKKRLDLWSRFALADPDLADSALEKNAENALEAENTLDLKPPLELNRLALSVDDIKKTKRFFKQALGFQPLQQSELKALYRFANFSLVVIAQTNLNQSPSPLLFEVEMPREQFQRYLARWSKMSPLRWDKEAILLKDPDGHDWRISSR